MIFFPYFPILAAILFPIAAAVSPIIRPILQWRYDRHYARQMREHKKAMESK